MYDIVVIGAGPAGVTAALRARELGAAVALVERGRMGGTCTNDGCVPTRVLAKAARLVRDAEQCGLYGIAVERPQVDIRQLMARTQQVIYQIHEKKQLLSHLEEAGVVVFAGVGSARFVDQQTLSLTSGETLSARRFIICAGGHARRLPFPGAELALTHSEIWQLDRLPKSMVVVGAAATGCQLASIFADFGSNVALLEMAPRIVPGEDELVSEVLQQAFEGRGIKILTGLEGVERIDQQEELLRLSYRQQGQLKTIDAESVVLAVGWPGNIEELDVGAAGVGTERGYIQVDDQLRTSAPHIFAAGDITGRIMLVQSGSHDARVAAENAVLDEQRSHVHHVVPHGGFTSPEYSGVGLTEAQARARHECAVAVIRYADLDRAVIDDHTEGFCKLIVERSSRKVLGAHVVGEQAVEVVQIVAAAMAEGTTVERLAELELAYPTYTAIVGLAARQLVRELGVIPLAPHWRGLQTARQAEWEHSD